MMSEFEPKKIKIIIIIELPRKRECLLAAIQEHGETKLTKETKKIS